MRKKCDAARMETMRKKVDAAHAGEQCVTSARHMEEYTPAAGCGGAVPRFRVP